MVWRTLFVSNNRLKAVVSYGSNDLDKADPDKENVLRSTHTVNIRRPTPNDTHRWISEDDVSLTNSNKSISTTSITSHAFSDPHYYAPDVVPGTSAKRASNPIINRNDLSSTASTDPNDPVPNTNPTNDRKGSNVAKREVTVQTDEPPSTTTDTTNIVEGDTSARTKDTSYGTGDTAKVHPDCGTWIDNPVFRTTAATYTTNPSTTVPPWNTSPGTWNQRRVFFSGRRTTVYP